MNISTNFFFLLGDRLQYGLAYETDSNGNVLMLYVSSLHDHEKLHFSCGGLKKRERVL